MHKDFKYSQIFKDAVQSGLNIFKEEDNLTFETADNLVNGEDYKIYYSECEEVLCHDDNNSVFEFMGMIQKYEQENFGAIHTDFSDSHKVANVAHYLLWESLSYELMNDLEIEIDDILTEKQVNIIIEKLESFL